MWSAIEGYVKEKKLRRESSDSQLFAKLCGVHLLPFIILTNQATTFNELKCTLLRHISGIATK